MEMRKTVLYGVLAFCLVVLNSCLGDPATQLTMANQAGVVVTGYGPGKAIYTKGLRPEALSHKIYKTFLSLRSLFFRYNFFINYTYLSLSYGGIFVKICLMVFYCIILFLFLLFNLLRQFI